MNRYGFSLEAMVVIVLATSTFLSCEDKGPGAPIPVITKFYPGFGVVGTQVIIMGNNFVAPVAPSADTLVNTSSIAFGGTVAGLSYAFQDSIGKQRYHTFVPAGATSGKITITTENGTTGVSSEDFIVVTPAYVPNVTVTTASNYGGRGVALDVEGTLYVTDANNFRILKITPDGTVTTLFTALYKSITFGIAVDANKNVYAAVDHTIIKITEDGTISTLAGSTAGYANGEGTNAQFYFPWGIAVDAGGNVYVCDALNDKVRKITPGGVVSTLAGGTAGYAEGLGTNAKFSFPMGMAVDALGNAFVADGGNNKIRKITPDGNVTTVAGTTKGYKDGTTSTAQFNNSYGIAVDANGNLYVGDGDSFVIRKITPDGNVTTVAGSTYGFADGPGFSAKFGNTKGVVVDANGVIYAADVDNYKIRKIVIE